MEVAKQLIEAIHMFTRAFEREADEALLSEIRLYCEAPLGDLNPSSQALADRAVSEFAKALASHDEVSDKTEWFDYLAAAYAELFLGVSEEPIAPYESVYLGAERTLHEKQYFEVKQFMSENGFEKPYDFHESEDHLAMEWRFVAYLLESSQAEAASRFITEHLSLWNDSACNDFIARDDSNGFYTGCALLAKAALSELVEK